MVGFFFSLWGGLCRANQTICGKEKSFICEACEILGAKRTFMYVERADIEHNKADGLLSIRTFIATPTLVYLLIIEP